MDSELDNLLQLVVAISCVTILLRGARLPARRYMRGWIVIAVLILAVIGLSRIFLRKHAALIALVCWVALIVVPALGDRLVRRLVEQQRYQAAHALSQVLALLHPADGWREQPLLLKSMVLLQQGDVRGAEALLARQHDLSATTARMARLQIFRVRWQWHELRDWVERLCEGDVTRLDSGSAQLYLRALGEIGDLSQMLRAYEQRRAAQRAPGPPLHDMLTIFAFSGAEPLLDRLLDGPLGHFSEDVADFWRATAALAGGRASSGRQLLQKLVAEADSSTRMAASRRLARPPLVAGPALTSSGRAVLAQADRELDQYARLSTRLAGQDGTARVTYGLIALNLLAFVLELAQGGSTSLSTLQRLGALMPAQVMAGEWWRVFAAQFLHFGTLHLVMNMGALYLLGRVVERLLGGPRYALAYLVAGSGAMLGVILLTNAGVLPEETLVGASGGVMGMVGASMALWLRAWFLERAPIALFYFREMAFVMVLQVIMDLFIIQQTSFSAHMIGFAAGALAGVVLAPRASHEEGERSS